MNRIKTIEPEEASTPVQELYAGIQKKLGMVPNMMRTLAVAPAALEAYLSLSGALGKGELPAKLREQIALTVAEMNGCNYCLAAHCALGGMAGLSKEQMNDSRMGLSTDRHTQAVLGLARAVVDERGRISEADFTAARKAGLSDGEIVEVAANVALNIFTNYFNNLAGTPIDFPLAEPLAVAESESCPSGV